MQMKRHIPLIFGFSLLLTSASVFSMTLDSSWVLTRFFARALPAETLMDNSEKGTLNPKVPGAVFSGGEFKSGFGVIFTAGNSRYALKSITMQIASFAQEPSFRGELRVSLYRMGEGANPSEPPVLERLFHNIEFPAREGYVSLDLSGVLLDPGVRYGLVLSAPNQFKSRIFGHQIPDVAPISTFGFTVESGMWGSSEVGWRRQLYPLIWIEGWDVENAYAQEIVRDFWLGAAVFGLGLLIGLWLFIKKRVSVQSR